VLSLVGWDITALAHTEEAEILGEAAHEVGILRRVLTHLMVEMGHDQL
jgi:hypothetical protein